MAVVDTLQAEPLAACRQSAVLHMRAEPLAACLASGAKYYSVDLLYCLFDFAENNASVLYVGMIMFRYIYIYIYTHA